jgi:hypothetical protein
MKGIWLDARAQSAGAKPSSECVHLKRINRRILFVFGGLVTLLLVAAVVGFYFFGRTTPPPLPHPNGYLDLTRAGHGVRGNLNDLAAKDLDDLRALLTTNADALRLLRVGLSRDCAVPTDAAIANFAAVSRDLVALKSLANLLQAEGRLAEMENRPGDAAQSYLDAMRLGGKISHGGLIIHRLVGIACEGIGRISLVKLLPQLSCDQIRPLVQQLEQIDEQTVAWMEVMRDEGRFARAQLGNYPNPIRLVSDFWNARKVGKTSEARHDLAAAHLRLLVAELALRSYRCEEGAPSGDLQRLVPKYLQRVPTDPFTGRPLVYKQTGTNWLLYSLGPDGADDGGKPMGRIRSGDHVEENKGDILYDLPW